MPLVTISVLNVWDNNQKRRISDIVHESLVDAFKIPDSDYNHRISEYTRDGFLYPKNRTEKYILIEMTIFPGRSKEDKKKLFRLITDRLASAMGIESQDITVLLNEPPLENWGLAGKSGEEADLGFNLKV
jgi:4-oxalocrotonate tautomerase family enzyme